MGQRGPGEQLTWAGGAAHGGLAVAPKPRRHPCWPGRWHHWTQRHKMREGNSHQGNLRMPEKWDV